MSLDQVYTSDLVQELCVWITATSPAHCHSGPGVGRRKLLLAQGYCSVVLLLLYFVQLFVNTTFLCLKFPNLNGFICFLTETLTDTEPTHNGNKKEKNTLKLTRNCRSYLKNTSKINQQYLNKWKDILDLDRKSPLINIDSSLETL